jgi:hypothetical protein
MYNNFIKVENPSNVTIVVYADDIALVVVAKKLADLIKDCNLMIAKIKSWLHEAGLELADHKTEVVLMSSRKKV